MALSDRSGSHVADVGNKEDGVDYTGLDPETPAVTHDGIDDKEDRIGKPDVPRVALGADIGALHRSIRFVAHDFCRS
jgi:hypothetical protein